MNHVDGPSNHFIHLLIEGSIDGGGIITQSCFVGLREQLKAKSNQFAMPQVQEEDHFGTKN